MEEEIVLCAANSYEQKYYLNPEFEMLPESIKQELNIMCVLYTEDPLPAPCKASEMAGFLRLP